MMDQNKKAKKPSVETTVKVFGGTLSIPNDALLPDETVAKVLLEISVDSGALNESVKR